MPDSSLYPESLENIIQTFARLPGIGRRTAERLALELLEWPQGSLDEFGEELQTLKQKITPCTQCGNFAEGNLCVICSSPQRNPEQICVVEQPTQIPVIEKAGCFRGQYHVLGGRLMPLEDVGPEDLRIQELHQRISDQQVEEIILATSSDVEGEATANYLAEELKDYQLNITRIASGVPVGADLSYADSATVAMAINKRSKWSAK